MALANWINQKRLVDGRIALLNPLRAELGLPPQSAPPFTPPPETGRGAGDARHAAAVYLKKVRENLDKQIAQARKDIAAGKGKSSTTPLVEFFKANDTSPRTFATGSPAPAATPSSADEYPTAAADSPSGILWALAGIGAYFILTRK